MVKVFGDDIVSAYTNGTPVSEIYANGVKVWPDGPEPSDPYVKWTPVNASGSFILGDEARWLSSYSGYYSGPFLWDAYIPIFNPSSMSGYVIDSSAFMYADIDTFETNCAEISQHAFYNNSSLTYANAKCYLIQNNAFRSCTHLYAVNLPNCQVIKTMAFDGCTNLAYISAPQLCTVGANAFGGCSNLTYLYLPECSAIDDYGFGFCSNLTSVYLPKCSLIGPSAFAYCKSLTTLQLGYSGVASLGESLFYSTSFRSYGTIYVPIEWVSEYKTSYPTFSSIIQPIRN